MKNERKNIRLRDYDYSKSGYYFVTICTNFRQHLFGEIKDGNMVLNESGKIVEKCINEIPEHFSFSGVDYYCIMPNHIHAIIVINDIPTGDRNIQHEKSPVGNRHACSLLHKPNSQLLPVIVGSLKSAISKLIHRIDRNNTLIWQKSYYEHIIRNNYELYQIRNYIINNPINWEIEKEINSNLEVKI